MVAKNKYACGTNVTRHTVGPIRHTSVVHPATGDFTSDGKSAGSSAFHLAPHPCFCHPRRRAPKPQGRKMPYTLALPYPGIIILPIEVYRHPYI
jgi:hypothetical protein